VAPESDERPAAREPPPRNAVFTGAVAVGGTVRLWQLLGRDRLAWGDTTDFLASARLGWTSGALWAGPRPPAVPVALKLVGADTGAYVLLQAVLAALCWAALATSVWLAVEGRGARWVAAGAVVAFSLTTPVVMWERSVLSESPALSVLALVAAAAVQLGRGVTGWRAVALLAALAAWVAVRDSHAVVAALVGLGAAGVLVGLRVRHRAGPRLALAGLAAGALLLAAGSAVAAAHGRREADPMRNVYEVRVLPYPDRVRWFAAHGMPDAGAFLGPDARSAYGAEGEAATVYVPDSDPDLQDWLAWVDREGPDTYTRWVVTHPFYLVVEPLRSPERTFNNARGERMFYAPADLRRLPLADRVLAPSTALALLVATLALGWVHGGRRWSPLAVVGGVVAVLAVPHALLAWHSDGMETARHLVVPALQLHLGVLLLVLGAVTATGGRSGRARLRSGHG
jgi:hypothetical protein